MYANEAEERYSRSERKMEKSVLEMNEEYKKKEKCKKMQTKRKQTNKRKGK